MSRKARAHRGRHHEEVEFLTNALQLNGATILDGPKKKRWTSHDIEQIRPLKPAQEEMFHSWYQGQNICAYGSAGTGKTFIAVYLALNEIVSGKSEYKKIKIVRSVVPTREVGYLPGTLEEKISVYEQPYMDIITDLSGCWKGYDNMKEVRLIDFVPTSFIRGLTWDNTIVIVDEGQNMNFHEIDSVMTRMGNHSRMIFTGDVKQSDLQRNHDQSGMPLALKVMENHGDFDMIKFTRHDVVRSDFVKKWITAVEDAAA